MNKNKSNNIMKYKSSPNIKTNNKMKPRKKEISNKMKNTTIL